MAPVLWPLKRLTPISFLYNRLTRFKTGLNFLALHRNITFSQKMSVVRKIINTPKAPKAIGPYSQAILVDKTLYVSGQIGMDPQSGNLVEGGTEAQAKKALENMGHILEAAGANYNSVVKTTVLLTDMNDYAIVNNVYAQFFKDNFPARAAYQVAALPKASQVEIEAIAIVGNITTANL